MKVLTHSSNYNEAIRNANDLSVNYEKSTTFHCFWNGEINEKHLYSILSCYYFNVYKQKHKIILWSENIIGEEYLEIIKKYAEIRVFNLSNELKEANITDNFYYKRELSFYSDVIRYLLLYNYGGCWFDLDCFFLRSFNPIFKYFEDNICVYQWMTQNYPNGAIYISLKEKSEEFRKNIEYIINNNKGWGFQEANLTFDNSMNLLVLPCEWFDPSWVKNPYSLTVDDFFKETHIKYDFTNFFPGSFCYHWHNRWDIPIHKSSIIMQLVSFINFNLNN